MHSERLRHHPVLGMSGYNIPYPSGIEPLKTGKYRILNEAVLDRYNMLKELLLKSMRRPAHQPTITIRVEGFHLYLNELHVGTLTYKAGEWTFDYSDAFRAQTEFPAIVDFPHKDRFYRSKDLWPFFELRIPSVNQHGVKRYMQEEKTTSPSAVELLKRFGRRAVANPYELKVMSDGAVAAGC